DQALRHRSPARAPRASDELGRDGAGEARGDGDARERAPARGRSRRARRRLRARDENAMDGVPADRARRGPRALRIRSAHAHAGGRAAASRGRPRGRRAARPRARARGARSFVRGRAHRRRASRGSALREPPRERARRRRAPLARRDALGAGYAGLTSFTLLEPEVVKLDMELVRGIDSHRTKRSIVTSMVTLCHDMGATVVAEGVETPAERDALVDLGCDLLQGYLLAKPAPPFPEFAW